MRLGLSLRDYSERRRAHRTDVRSHDQDVGSARAEPQDKPVYFVVSGMRFTGETNANNRGDDDDPVEQARHKQFYYEEHSCPTNWLDPEMVYFDGDSDPHGLIEFVTSRDAETFPHE